MPRRTIRLSVDADERLQSAVKLRGYPNPSAFLRTAIDHELKGHEETMRGAEERLATSLYQISREISRLGRAQQALFASVDSLAKILLTCIPEPGAEAMEAAVTRAKAVLQVSKPERRVRRETGLPGTLRQALRRVC
jgi:Arc/MetJ-type ribon-helix-helix transcriptional regulator